MDKTVSAEMLMEELEYTLDELADYQGDFPELRAEFEAATEALEKLNTALEEDVE